MISRLLPGLDLSFSRLISICLRGPILAHFDRNINLGIRWGKSTRVCIPPWGLPWQCELSLVSAG